MIKDIKNSKTQTRQVYKNAEKQKKKDTHTNKKYNLKGQGRCIFYKCFPYIALDIFSFSFSPFKTSSCVL